MPMFGYTPYGVYDYDLLYFLLIAVMVLGLIASARVKSVFKKYSSFHSPLGIPAHEVARRLLISGGSDAQLERVSGKLTDHYDPRTDVVGLSDEVYDEASIAAMAVAAHEIGHVMQYEDGYVPIKLRGALLPVANIGSSLSPLIVILGIVMGSYPLAIFGAWLFGGILMFQLVTLPVELNASRRAIEMLSANGFLTSPDEERAARRVLRAAAMTYVMATLAALVSFIRLFALAGRARRR